MRTAEAFGRSGFSHFMNSPTGRITRAVAGLLMIGWGSAGSAGPSGMVLMVLGLILLAAGVFNLCVISALLGGPIRGAQLGSRRSQ